MEKTNRESIVTVVPYDPNWSKLFALEAEELRNILKNNCVTIHHIGSTAIPDLVAKPVIDLLIIVHDLEQLAKQSFDLEKVGYVNKGEHGIAFRRFFQKKSPHPFNVHVYEIGNPEIDRHLLFRDWLCQHREDRERYATLKLQLAKQYPNNIEKYCNGKNHFVLEIDAKDGFTGWRMVHAFTEEEWSTVRYLRNYYFFKTFEDPYTWTFKEIHHVHFVYYQKATRVGYCHIQLWPENRAALRIIAIDENFRQKGIGSSFLLLCEKWLKSRGTKELLIQSNPAALSFYKKNGYSPMPFNDPKGNETDPQDTELGKRLL
nr:dephospho-CoA kinase/protein folding accessory domain-containing protein [Candidatus Rubidus massiliensis]